MRIMISDVVRGNLLLLATTYAKVTGLSLATVSSRFYGNPLFFDELRRNKRSVTVLIVDTMIDKFSREWPDDEPWPTLNDVRIERIGKQIFVENNKISDKRKKRIAV